jgi:hypothetical protein
VSATPGPTALEPQEVADWLDAWALRREKVLERLDVQAARGARRLAERCRRMTRSDLDAEAQRREWVALRLEIADFVQAAGGRSRPSARVSVDLSQEKSSEKS